jgi:putative flippase GtrA
MSTAIEILRFGVVGLASNALLYLLYLAATAVGVEPKVAVSLIYLVGVLQTFILNKRWTFQHEGHVRRTAARYWVAYGFSYAANMVLLIIFVDVAGFDHRVVQGVLIAVIGLVLFALQKYWVFGTLPVRQASGSSRAGEP